ncbi:phage tail tape measure protein [Agrilactobacillus fermenti]|uniref:phage tail tape measure protein n=1 Tax=Agrilactobacillus fermenti TaxID=2586909 RepID=UPI001E63D174|nr:phage tail tape measure protein [Agrilactobacillus fermenti]MCD2256407.1 phage tail tape measure protein [Agrilactobacillus fermenti]
MATEYSVQASLSAVDKGFGTVFQKAIGQVREFSANVGSSLESAGKQVQGFGKTLGIIGTAVSAFGISSLSSFGQFEASLNKAAVTAGGTSKDIKGLADVANEMGAVLPISAQDAADAMIQMAQAGADVGTIKEQFPAIAQAATATGADLTDTATVVQNAMNIWGDSVKYPARAAAILTDAANLSNAGIADMKQALATIGGTARSAGIGLEDTTTAIGLLTNRGYSAAQASQDLNHAILQMMAPSKIAKGEMTELGLSFVDAQGNMKPLPQILSEVNQALNGLAPDEKVAALKKLFGTAGMGAILPLLDSIADKSGSTTTSWDAFSQKLQVDAKDNATATKFLSDQASEMQKNTGSKLEQVGGNWESLRNTAMQAQEGITGGMLDLVNKTLEWATQSDSGIAKVTRAFLGLAPVIGPVVVAIGGFLTAAGKITSTIGSLTKLGGIFGALSTPIGLAVAAVAILAAGFAALYASSEPFRNAVQTIVNVVGKNLGAAFTTASNELKTFANSIKNDLAGNFNASKESVQSFADTISGALNDAIMFVVKTIETVVTAIMSMWNAFKESGGAQAALNLIKNTVGLLKDAFDALVPSASNSGSGVSNAFSTVGTVIGNVVKALSSFVQGIRDSGAVKAIIDGIKGAFDNLLIIFDPIIKAITNFVTQSNTAKPTQSIWYSIGKAIGSIAKFIGQLIPYLAPLVAGFMAFKTTVKVLNTVKSAVNGVGSAFKLVQSALAALKTAALSNPFILIIAAIAALVAGLVLAYNKVGWFRDFVNSIPKTIQSGWNALVEFFTTLWTNVQNVFKTAWDTIKAIFSPVVDALKTAWQGLSEFFTALWTTIQQVFQTAWDVITAIFGPVIDTIKTSWNGMTEFFTTLWTGVQGVFQAAWDLIKAIFQPIIDFLKSIWTPITEFFTTLWDGVTSVFSTAWDIIKGTFQVVVDLLKSVWDTVSPFFTALWEGIKTVFSAAWDVIKTVVSTAFDAVKTTIETVIGVIKTIWDTGWNVISTILKTVWDVMSTIVKTVLDVIKGIIKTVTDAIKGNWSAVWNDIKGIVSTVWNGIKSVVNTVINAVKGIISSVLNAIQSIWSKVWNGIKSVAKSIWDGIKSVIKTGLDAVSNIVQTGMNAIKQFFSSIWDKFKGIVSNAWGGIKSAASGLLNNLKGLFDPSLLVNAGKKIIEGFLRGLKSAFEAVKDFVGGIGKWIADHKGPISYDKKLLIPAGNAIMNGLNNGLVDSFGGVIKSVSSMSDSIAQAAVPNISTADIAGTLAAANKQLNSGLSANVSGQMILTHQPANVTLNMGGHEWKGYVDDISGTQDSSIQLHRYKL